MIIDEQIPAQLVREFASELKKLPPQQVSMLEQLFIGDKSDDFYRGLLTGFLCSVSVIEAGLPPKEYIKVLLVFVAHKLEQKEIV